MNRSRNMRLPIGTGITNIDERTRPSIQLLLGIVNLDLGNLHASAPLLWLFFYQGPTRLSTRNLVFTPYARNQSVAIIRRHETLSDRLLRSSGDLPNCRFFGRRDARAVFHEATWLFDRLGRNS